MSTDKPDTAAEPVEPATDETEASETETAEEEAEVVELDPKDATIIALQGNVESLQGEIAALQARLRQVSKAYSDQKQEMADFRSRTEAQIKIREQRQSFTVVKTFFEPVQNLKRSVDSSGTADKDSLLQGLKLTLHQFMDGLSKLGLQRVPGVGAPFNPAMHAALAIQPVTDEAQDGVVLMVHLDGYMVDGKALQPSQVIVGKYTAPEPAPEAEAPSESEEPTDA